MLSLTYNIIYYVSLFLGILHRLRGTWGWFAKVNGVVLGLLYFILFQNYYIAIFGCLLYILGESYGWGDPVGCTTETRNTNSLYFEKTEDGANYGIRFLSILTLQPKNYKDIFYNAKVTIKKNIKLILFKVNNIIYYLANKVLSISYKVNNNKLIKSVITYIFNLLYNLSNKGFKLIDNIVIFNYREVVIKNFLTYSRVYLIYRGIYWWLLPIGILYFVDVSVIKIIVSILLLSFGWVLCAELGYISTKYFNKPYMAGGWEHQEVWYGALITLVFVYLLY